MVTVDLGSTASTLSPRRSSTASCRGHAGPCPPDPCPLAAPPSSHCSDGDRPRHRASITDPSEYSLAPTPLRSSPDLSSDLPSELPPYSPSLGRSVSDSPRPPPPPPTLSPPPQLSSSSSAPRHPPNPPPPTLRRSHSWILSPTAHYHPYHVPRPPPRASTGGEVRPCWTAPTASGSQLWRLPLESLTPLPHDRHRTSSASSTSNTPRSSTTAASAASLASTASTTSTGTTTSSPCINYHTPGSHASPAAPSSHAAPRSHWAAHRSPPASHRRRRTGILHDPAASSSPAAAMNQYEQQQRYSAPAPESPPLWSPNVFYPLGALVWHAGSVWRCDSPHTSGSLAREASREERRRPASTPRRPTLTPQPTQSFHLWTPVGSSVAHAPGSAYASSHGAAMFAQAPPGTPPNETDRARTAAMREDQDAARNPAALRDELLGVRTWRVGGVGIWAYSEDIEMERTRRAVWKEFTEANGKEAWVNAARAHTAAYRAAGANGQLRPLLRWHLVEGSAPIPEDALVVGQERDGKNLYTARIWHSKGLHLGKAADHLYRRCEYSWGGRTWAPDENPVFEVLCGQPDAVQWIPFEPGTAANQPGWQPVEGGRETDGRAILVARGTHEGSVQPGKVQVDAVTAMIPYGGSEVHIRPFQVLAYASYSRR